MNTVSFFLLCILYAVSATGEVRRAPEQASEEVESSTTAQVQPSTDALKTELLSTLDAKIAEFSTQFESLRAELVADLQAPTSDDPAITKKAVNELIEGYVTDKLGATASRKELLTKELSIRDEISQARSMAAIQTKEAKKECRKLVEESASGLNFEELGQSIAARVGNDVHSHVRESLSGEIQQTVADALAEEVEDVRQLVDTAVEANNAKVSRLVEASIEALSTRAEKSAVSRTELAELRVDVTRLRARVKELQVTVARVEKQSLAYIAGVVYNAYVAPALEFGLEVLYVYRDGFVFLYYDLLQADKVLGDLSDPKKGGVLVNVVDPEFWKNTVISIVDMLSTAKKGFDDRYWPQLQQDAAYVINVCLVYLVNIREVSRASEMYKMLRWNTRTLSSKYAGFCFDENLTEDQQQYVYDGIFLIVMQIIVVMSWSVFKEFCGLLCPILRTKGASPKVADGSKVTEGEKERTEEIQVEQAPKKD